MLYESLECFPRPLGAARLTRSCSQQLAATTATQAHGTPYWRHLGATFGCRSLALEFSRGSREQPRLRRNLPEPAAKARAGLLVRFLGFASLAHLNLMVLALPNPSGAAEGSRKKALQPNYSLSIAVQENALRVTWLMPGTSGSAAGDPRVTRGCSQQLAHQPAAPRQIFGQE